MENFITYDVEYLGGHPEWPFTCKIELTVRKTYREIFIKEKGFLNRRARFDVVALDYSSFEEKLDLIRDAFALEGSFNY